MKGHEMRHTEAMLMRCFDLLSVFVQRGLTSSSIEFSFDPRLTPSTSFLQHPLTLLFSVSGAHESILCAALLGSIAFELANHLSSMPCNAIHFHV
jgi:hypothetical protein